MKPAFRLIALLFSLAALVACEAGSPEVGETDGDGIEADGLDSLEGIAKATECEVNADCAAVFDSHSCHLAACDPVAGHCRPLAKPEGTSCEGSETPCGGIGSGVCDPDGSCVVDPASIGEAGCDDGNPCTVDDCHPEFGCLSTLYVADHTECDDGNACTVATSCQGGQCVGETLEDCVPPDPDDPDKPDKPDKPDEPNVQACLDKACSEELELCAEVPGCLELRECLEACGPGEENQDCREECTDDAPGDAFDAYIPTWLCGVEKGCFANDGKAEPSSVCLVQECGDSYGACLVDDGCYGLMGCFADCEEDQGCVDQCWQAAPQGVKQLYGALYECYNDHECADAQPPDKPDEPEEDPVYSCIEKACPEELEAGWDDDGCAAVLLCLDDCDDDSQCDEECFGLAQGPSQFTFYGLAGCANDAGCLDEGGEPDPGEGPNFPEPVEDCLMESCGGAYEVCMDDEGCVWLIGCLQECQGDQGCKNECSSEASPNDKQKFGGLTQCGQEHECFGGGNGGEPPGEEPGPIQECLTDQCENSYITCIYDEGCVGIFGCMDECGDDQECDEACYWDASGSDQQKFGNLVQCGQDHGCFEVGGQGPDPDPDPEPNPTVLECIEASCDGAAGNDVPGSEETLKCVAACENVDCAFDCAGDAPEAASGWAMELVFCALDHQCFEDGTTVTPDSCGNNACEEWENGVNCPQDCNDPDGPVACIDTHCGQQLEICGDTDDCWAGWECWTECNGPTCQMACFDDLNVNADGTLKAVLSCGDNHGCYAEEPPGEAVCGNNVCEFGEDGFNCAADCKGPSEPGDPNDPDDPKDPDEPVDPPESPDLLECAENHCADTLDVCLDSEGCEVIVECIAECEDENCGTDCAFADGWPPDDFWDLYDCVSSAGCL